MYFTPLNNIAIFSREVSSLKSRILSSDTDYHTGENLRTVDGQIPLVSCPLGYLIDNYVSYLKDIVLKLFSFPVESIGLI